MNKFNKSVKQETKKWTILVSVVVFSLAICITLSLIATAARDYAYADPQSEADAVAKEISNKQEELESTSADYTVALRDYNEAKGKVDEARERIDYCSNQIAKTQNSLSTQVKHMYKTKSSLGILELFLTVDSFDGFFKVWDIVEKRNQQFADDIGNCKNMRQEMEEQKTSLDENLEVCSAKEAEARRVKNQAESVIANLQNRYNALSAEAKELARRRQEEQQRRSTPGGGGGWHGGDTGSVVADRALGEIGKPYVWGAAGPGGYDCSGLCSYALTGAHVHRYVASDFLGWPRVSDPQAGDICTSGGHCGVYVGGGSMCHAPTFGRTVCVEGVHAGMIIVGHH